MRFNTSVLKALAAVVLAMGATGLASLSAAQAQSAKAKADIVLVDARDKVAVRNINNALTRYPMMIYENKAVEGTAKFLIPAASWRCKKFSALGRPEHSSR